MLSTAVFLASLLVIARAQSVPCDEKTEFQCPGDGSCFPLVFLCDNITDCEDGFDEQNCTALSAVPCEENESRCQPDSPCFPLDYLCNIEFFCDDEFYKQNCASVPCLNLETHFRCPTGSLCITNIFVCDDSFDCDDGFDELNCTTAYLTLSGDTTPIPNHGYVAISDIGSTNVTALICHTKHPYSSHSDGDWFAPDRTVVSGDDVPGLTTYEHPIAVRLFRNAATDPAPEGIYQCVVEFDTLTEQTIYVGLYYSGGDLSIPNTPTLTINSDLSGEFTLTFVSTGGPATTVTWTRNSKTVTEGITETVLDDRVASQYTHTLTVTGKLGGLYTCTVANNKPSEYSKNFHVRVASAPTNLMAVQEGLTSVRVSWSPPTPLGDTTGYRIYYSGNNSGNVSVTDGSTDNALLTGLQNGSIYIISIVATSLHFSSTAINEEVILYPSITTCSLTDYTAAITGAVVVAVVFIISATVVIVVLLLRGKQKSSSSEINSATTKATEAYEHYELSGDTGAIHTSTNEAYDQTTIEDPVYEPV